MSNDIVKKLGMKNDIVFKTFFSREENLKYLEEFISSILEEQVKVKKVIHDARLEQITQEDKYGVLDLDVELEEGKKVNIEIQLKDNKNIEKRTTYYSSKKITEQLSGGQKFEELKEVIIIAILDYSFINQPEYITRTVRVAKEHKDYEINNIEKYIYIELKKFREQNPDMKEKLNQWLAFIDRERGDLLDMAKKENEEIEEADEKYNVLTGDAELRRLAEIRHLSELEGYSMRSVAKEEGYKEGIEKGIEKGKIEGIKESNRKIVQKLKARKVPIEEIKEITELTEEEIEEIE